MTDEERVKLAATMIDDALEGLSDDQVGAALLRSRGSHVNATALLLRTATALRHGSPCECPDCYELVDAVDAWLKATQADTYLSPPLTKDMIAETLEHLPSKVRDHFYEGMRVPKEFIISKRRGEGKEEAARLRSLAKTIPFGVQPGVVVKEDGDE